MTGKSCLIVSPCPKRTPGGVARYVEWQQEIIGAAGWRVELFESFIEAKRSEKYIFQMKRLVAFCRRSFRRNDVIWLHGSEYRSLLRKSAYAWIAKKRGASHTVLHLHAAKLPEADTVSAKFASFALSRAGIDQVIVLSEHWREQLNKMVPKMAARLTVVPNPIETDVAIAVSEWRALHDRDIFSDKKISFFGRLGQRKGLDVILKFAAGLHSRHYVPEPHICLYGDGECEKARVIARELHIDRMVSVQGWVGGEERLRALKSAYCNILPSRGEGLPFSVIDALGCGIPCVISDIPPHVSAFQGLPGVFFHKDGDDMSLLEQIEALLKLTLTDYKILCRRTRAAAMDRFGSEAIAGSVVRILEES